MKRFYAELAFFFGALLLISLAAGGGDDDDEENWVLNMASYQSRRFITESTFYINPTEGLKLLRSPSASLNTIEQIFNYLGMIASGKANNEIERGSYKGHTRLYKDTRELIPIYGQVHDWFTPDEKLAFYK